MVKTINYITFDPWWDTDKTILPSLCKKYDVNVFVFDGAIGNGKYPQKENYGFKLFFHKKQKYRDRDIRELFESISWFKKILNANRDMSSINIVIPNKNPYLSLLFLLFLPVSRTIICSHNYIEHVGRRIKVEALLKKLMYKRFRFFQFYSELQKSLFAKDFPKKEAYCVNMPLKDYGRPKLQRNDKRRTFLFFGAIADYKRLDLFIKAANSFSGSKLVRFVIAGKCSTGWDKYQNLIKDSDIFDLSIGFVKDEDVSDLFCNADFLVLPYADSTQSGPSLIAINYGIPIIASNLTSFQTIVKDGKNGFLFESGDLEGLISVLNRAVSITEPELDLLKSKQLENKANYLMTCDVIGCYSNIFKEIDN